MKGTETQRLHRKQELARSAAKTRDLRNRIGAMFHGMHLETLRNRLEEAGALGDEHLVEPSDDRPNHS